MEYEKSYIFEPEDTRPNKRRCVESRGLQTSWPIRKKAFATAWKVPRDRIDEKLKIINASTVNDVVDFLDQSIHDAEHQRIPAALILAGPSSALRTSILSQVAAHTSKGSRKIFVPLASNAGTNLKGVLKTVIQRATLRTFTDDEEEELEASAGSRKGPKLLNYDLEALYEHVRERSIDQVVIMLEDTEAFDGDLLSELIELFGFRQGRIPFAFLFNIATSVEFLQQRLSRPAIRCLSGRLFDAALSDDEVEQVCEALTASWNGIYLGGDIMTLILERQTDYIQSIDSFIEAAHYAYMSCYYANALSIFLDPDIKFEMVPKSHFEALRNTPSFRDYIQIQSNGEDIYSRKLAHDVLECDKALFDFALHHIYRGKRAIGDMITGTEVLRILQMQLTPAKVSSRSRLYVQAMSGRLATSSLVRELLLSLRKAPSDIVLRTLRRVLGVGKSEGSMLDQPFGGELELHTSDELFEVFEAIGRLVQGQEHSRPLRSEDDIQNATLRTTVIAQKVELSKQKSTLSKQDAAYTEFLRTASDTLSRYFGHSFSDPKHLLFGEVFIYDLKSPYREVFAPRPRAAIERALAAPHDYLSCECCHPQQGDGEDATLGATQPATAIVYQLYLESGSLINVSDLWQAFQAVVGDTEVKEQKTMALFQKALAELRYLGLVKNTRKRVDHIAKVAWRGL